MLYLIYLIIIYIFIKFLIKIKNIKLYKNIYDKFPLYPKIYKNFLNKNEVSHLLNCCH